MAQLRKPKAWRVLHLRLKGKVLLKLLRSSRQAEFNMRSLLGGSRKLIPAVMYERHSEDHVARACRVM